MEEHDTALSNLDFIAKMKRMRGGRVDPFPLSEGAQTRHDAAMAMRLTVRGFARALMGFDLREVTPYRVPRRGSHYPTRAVPKNKNERLIEFGAGNGVCKLLGGTHSGDGIMLVPDPLSASHLNIVSDGEPGELDVILVMGGPKEPWGKVMSMHFAKLHNLLRGNERYREPTQRGTRSCLASELHSKVAVFVTHLERYFGPMHQEDLSRRAMHVSAIRVPQFHRTETEKLLDSLGYKETQYLGVHGEERGDRASVRLQLSPASMFPDLRPTERPAVASFNVEIV